jgi:hypothetical protein
MIIDRDTRAEVDARIKEILAGEEALMIMSMACVAKQALDPMLRTIFPDDDHLRTEKALYVIGQMAMVAGRLHDRFPEIHRPLLLKGLLVSGAVLVQEVFGLLSAADAIPGIDDDGFAGLIGVLDRQIEKALAAGGDDARDAVRQAGGFDVN